MNLMGIPDQLDANYGESDSPAVRFPGSMRAVPNNPHSHNADNMVNPYSQFGTPNLARKNSPPPYPTQEIDGYKMQMINGVPNVAPLAIDQVSPTPFNRGDFDVVYNMTGKPYDWAKGPTYGNPYGFTDWFNNLWSKDVPPAPIGAESTAQARLMLSNALYFIGLMPAPSDSWPDIQPVLQQLQNSTKIPVTGTYDLQTQEAVAKAFTAKRQGKALTDVWSQIETSGVLPDWWNQTQPAPVVSIPTSGSSDSNVLKYGLIAVAVLGTMIGIGMYVRNRNQEG